MGQRQKMEKKEKEEEERLNHGDNNGQATHGASKPPGPTTQSFTGGWVVVVDQYP